MRDRFRCPLLGTIPLAATGRPASSSYASPVADRQEIHAVYVDDRDALLDRLGLLDAYRSGRLLCEKCERPIRDHGFGAVRMVGEEIRVTCAEPGCTDGEPV
jgi:hypothetical protein